MRRLAKSLAWLGLSAVMVGGATTAQAAPPPTPAVFLGFAPRFPGVECDTPTDPAAIEACKVEPAYDAKKRAVGWLLRDGQGKLLRRFVDTDGDEKRMTDQWSYYQDGFEVYREIDLTQDRKLDEIRWLNGGGTRYAEVEAGKIKAWKQISAEEASKVLVQALVANDLWLLQSVMATPGELAAAGVPKASISRVAARSETLAADVEALRQSLTGWNAQTIWNRFDGTYPHVIPAEAGGLEKDLVLYENAMIFPSIPMTGNAAQPRMAFLQIPDLIQLGDTWKFIELPRAIDPEKPVVASNTGLRSTLFDRPSDSPAPRDEVADAAFKALVDYDNKNANLSRSADKREFVNFHLGRIPLLKEIVKATKDPEDQLSYAKQRVDSLVAALRTGEYPQGRAPLEAIVAEGGKLGSYAAYSLIGADFVLANEQPGGNMVANQKQWIKDLEGFMTKFPGSDEVPEVLYQLAIANEFSAEEETARKQYAQVAEGYPNLLSGKKAAGAVRRLDLNGKSFDLRGQGLKPGTIVDSTQLRGKPVLVVFWATLAKRDLPELVKLYEKYHGLGLEIIGVNLDADRAELEAFLATTPLPWPQIFEPGGMESRLGLEYGIISLPTIFLIDDKGTVVSHNVRPADAERQIEKLLPRKAAAGGAATGVR